LPLSDGISRIFSLACVEELCHFLSQSCLHYIRAEGIASYLLASLRTSNAEFLTTSVVEIKPGGKQRIHHYVPEQIYYMLEGSGLMTVAE